MNKYLVFLIFLSSHLIAQEVNVLENIMRDGIEKHKHKWEASWISHPTESQLDYGVFIFRNTFEISDVPENAKIFVSADNRYKLYVNGQYVSNGPSRGDLLHWRYETVDISNYLNTGKNIVAAEVINYGASRPAAQHYLKTEFILQAENNELKMLNTGSGNWKVIKNRAFQPIVFTSDMLLGYYAAGPCDSVTAKLYPWGWNKEVDFDDTSWELAKVTDSGNGVGRGFLFGAGHHLVPRTIPAMEQKEERINKIARSSDKALLNAGFIKGASTIIPENSKVKLLLDLNYLTIGYPQLKISKGEGSKIKLTYAETLRDENDKKGNRNEIEGKEILGYYDVYYPDGGDNRTFEPLWLRTFRYVQLDIETGSKELVLNDYYNIFTAYPFEQKGAFNTSDEKLKQIWDVSWRTARLCAGETYFDCPYYEQLQYVGDTRIQALISLYVTGDDRLMRKAIEVFDDSRVSDGLTLSRYPSYIPQIIPPYSLMWVNMIYDYYMYRGDSLFINKYSMGMVNVLEWFADRVDNTGMVGPVEWWNFTDWTPDFNIGIPDGADNGHSAIISLQYVYALQKASEVFGYLGDTYYAEKYSTLAENIQKAVISNCYDEAKGLIAETPDKERFSQLTTLFAILTNTIEESKQAEVLKKVLAEKDIIEPTIYFRFYLSRSLQKTGLGDLYLNHLDAWYNMLNQGLTTFAEEDINPRSDCHAWSASPLFDFLHIVAGIQPASPEFKTVLIEPNFGELNRIDAKIPHPKGDITINLSKDKKDKINGFVEMPEGLTGIFKFKGNNISLKGGKQNIKL